MMAVLAITAAACSSSTTATSSTASSTTARSTTATSSSSGSTTATSSAGSITVFAASSLTKAFTDEGAAFSAANPAQKVTFNFGGSSALVQQIDSGAPADVFASADDANMKKL